MSWPIDNDPDLLAAGQTCGWCSRPAVAHIVIEPARYRMVTKTGQDGKRVTAPEVTQFAIYADACAEHEHVRDREGGKQIRDKRRVKATGVQQLNIFADEQTFDDVCPKPINAIRGTR